MTDKQTAAIVRYFHADCSFNETLGLVFGSSNANYGECLTLWLNLCKQYDREFA